MKSLEELLGGQTAHPMMPVLTAEDLRRVARAKGPARAAELLEEREAAIERAAADPLRCGFRLKHWDDAKRLLADHDELWALGGNRSGKSEFGGYLVADVLAHKEDGRGWCLHSTAPSSVEMQQPYVRKYLPAEWRNMGKRGQRANVSWTDKNGFSEGVFVLPNASRCRFLNYSMDVKVIEGGELDIVWADELIPPDWVETLRFRIVTRAGKLFISFTPKNGFTRTVWLALAGARVVETRPAPLLDPKKVHVPGCPPGHMPYILQGRRKNTAIICFYSEWNPFGGYQALVRALAGAVEAELKIRAYGWADKLEGKCFPKFRPEVHVVKHEAVPKKGTRYCVTDPAGARNWFFIWALVDEQGRIFIYREWPDRARYGEWALPGDKAEGKPGPAMHAGFINSIKAIKARVLAEEGVHKGTRFNDQGSSENGARTEPRGQGEARTEPRPPGEGQEEIFERLIDPRLGGSEVPGQDEGTSLIGLLEEEQRDGDGNVVGPSLVFHPAPGGPEEAGHQAINDALDYDENTDLSVMNCPRLYVSERCENVIYALQEHTGLGGKNEATKDPIDCIRYLLMRGPQHVEAASLEATGGF